MRHSCDHSTDRRRIDHFARRVQLSESEPFDDPLLPLRETDRAAIIVNLDLGGGRSVINFFVLHRCLPPATTSPIISSRDFSRSRATSLGSLKPFKPSNVALITLCGFEAPIDFVRTFETPAACMTARTAPPAMMPVPS